MSAVTMIQGGFSGVAKRGALTWRVLVVTLTLLAASSVSAAQVSEPQAAVQSDSAEPSGAPAPAAASAAEDQSGIQPAAADSGMGASGASDSGSSNQQSREMLRRRLAALNPFRAHFAQSVEGARGQALEESTGELAMQRPNFRWQVDEPYPQIIVADGERLSIYDPDLEQVILRDLDTALADTPIALLTQSQLVLSDQFEVLLLPPASPGEAEVFLLSPQDPDSLFQEVQLHFQASTLKQLKIYDHLGQSTTVLFRPVAVDGALAPSLFQLELPDGVDVIDG